MPIKINITSFHFLFQGGKQGSPHMSRKTLDGPAGMIGGAYLPSAALLHEAKLGEDSFTIILILLSCHYIQKYESKKPIILFPSDCRWFK